MAGRPGHQNQPIVVFCHVELLSTDEIDVCLISFPTGIQLFPSEVLTLIQFRIPDILKTC
jgi:hypothetical protein